MGWDFTHGATKSDIVKERVRSCPGLVTHKVVGNEMWCVERVGQENIIVLFLLAKDGPNWGYKDMTEAMGPYHYRCPVEFFAMAPVKNPEWRARVEAHRALVAAMEKVQPGDYIEVPSGSQVLHCRVRRVGPKSFEAYSHTRDRVYRISRAQVSGVRFMRDDGTTREVISL